MRGRIEDTDYYTQVQTFGTATSNTSTARGDHW